MPTLSGTKHSGYRKKKLWFCGGTNFYPHEVLFRKNGVLMLVGQWDLAGKITGQCLTQAESSDDQQALSEALMARASLLYIQGHYPQTLELYQRAQVLYAEAGRHEQLDMMQLSLGSLYVRMARFDRARECYRKALERAAVSGDKRLEMRVWLNLGLLHIQLEEHSEAYRECKKALELAHQLDDPTSIYRVRINLGIAARETGLLDEALECAKHTITYAKRINEKRGCGMGMNNAGLVWQKLGKLDKAVEYFREYLALAESMGDLNNQAIASNNIAGALLEKGEPAEAEQKYLKAHDIMKGFGNKLYQADALYHLAKVRKAVGDLKGTKEYLAQAITLGETITSNPYLGKYLKFQQEISG